jgi:hypothetical protein
MGMRMKLRVNFDLQGLSVDETVEGSGASEITRQAKTAIAGRLGFIAGAFVRSMPDIEFAREVVRRYNSATGTSCAAPVTVDEFIHWVLAQKLATVVE